MRDVSHSAARQLYIVGSQAPRPQTKRAIYCDGGVDGLYREGIDLELSHWIPNTTAEQFKASTSTEICMKYVAVTPNDSADLVINNHVDVDGVLSTFVLLYPKMALQHRDVIVQAAEMGDFAGWGTPLAQQLCHALICLIAALRKANTDPQAIYLRCYERVNAVLAGEKFADAREGISAMQAALDRVASGSIQRNLISPRFAHYAIPKEIAAGRISDALYAPRFDDVWSSTALLPPNVRAKFDNEKIHLVSVQSDTGTYFDLWYPGYSWAETVGLWLAPGIRSTGDSNHHHLEFPPLQQAIAELQVAENKMATNNGSWQLARSLSPFATIQGRNFPIVLSFLLEDKPSVSQLPEAFVVATLGAALASL